MLTVAVSFSRSNRGEWEIYRASRWAAGYRALASAGRPYSCALECSSKPNPYLATAPIEAPAKREKY